VVTAADSAGMRNSFSSIRNEASLPFRINLWTCCVVQPHRSASCLGLKRRSAIIVLSPFRLALCRPASLVDGQHSSFTRGSDRNGATLVSGSSSRMVGRRRPHSAGSPRSRHPIALEEVVLPLERLAGLSPNGGSDIPDITELAQRHGLLLGRATERISIVQATKDVAQHLRIAVGTGVMKLDRVTETADGEPVEWRVAFRKV
jgi:hypothetical protein